jgi:hypothetical protein
MDAAEFFDDDDVQELGEGLSAMPSSTISSCPSCIFVFRSRSAWIMPSPDESPDACRSANQFWSAAATGRNACPSAVPFLPLARQAIEAPSTSSSGRWEIAYADLSRERPGQLGQLTGESELSGTEPLVLRRLEALVFEVLDRERVAALQHLDAGAALLGDRLPVLAGADAQ